jgi:hypothetical protein
MRQTRSRPKQLRALAEELDARQEAKCQKREIDLVHHPSAQHDERQKSIAVDEVANERKGRHALQTREAARA